MGTHMIALSETYLMNTNMTGFDVFLRYLCLSDAHSLSIGRVNSHSSPAERLSVKYVDIYKIKQCCCF